MNPIKQLCRLTGVVFKKTLRLLYLVMGNQLALFTKVIRKGVRFLTLYRQALGRDLQTVYHKIKFSSEASGPVEFNKDTTHDNNDIKITFFASVRRANNPNCRLELFLQSVVDHAENLNRIEVLLAIDKDDEMSYFGRLQQIYAKKFKFKIFISDVRHGYQKLHIYDRDLFKKIAPGTRMLCDYSDDCYITLKHFDSTLLKIDSLYADNIYFIHTRNTGRAAYLGDVSQNMLVLFWALQALEPGSFFPIFSKRVLDIATDYAAVHDKNQEWSPLCNTWICDCYVDIIANYVKRFGVNRIHHFDMIEMNKFAVVAPHHRPPSEYGLSPNNLAFIKMLQDSSQQYLEGLSKVIADSALPPLSPTLAPKISIIIAVLNMKQYLARAIESVIAQQYSNVELIVLDGGSTDGTLDVIKQYAPHITFWKSEKDLGHIDACNKALHYATGDLITLLNADDVWAPDLLKQVVDTYNDDPSVKIISCGAVIKRKMAESNEEEIVKTISKPIEIELNLFNMLFLFPLINTRFFSKELFQTYGHFKATCEDGSYYVSNDREFMIRLVLNHVKTTTISKPLYEYYSHPESLTFGTHNLIKIHYEHLWLTNHLLSNYKLSEKQLNLICRWRAKQLIVLMYLLIKDKKLFALPGVLKEYFSRKVFRVAYQMNKYLAREAIKFCRKAL